MIVHGHRGCRGTHPENSIEGFLYATSLGVDYLELDVVCTGDHRVLVSHEPFMHHEICATPDRKRISPDEERLHNIYRMTAKEAQAFRLGTFPHPRFPHQQCIETHKPLLNDAIKEVAHFAKKKSLKFPCWNIELKSVKEEYGIFQPNPAEYAQLLIGEIRSAAIEENCLLQSFDTLILNELYRQAPEIKLVFLSEHPSASPETQLCDLKFRPFAYSPNYKYINDSLIEWSVKQGIELLAWTVNSPEEALRLFHSGIRHIITDYPEQILALRTNDLHHSSD
ncbi:MAG: glycerophosphodiester phosphodiesterase [Crocinitomicaceae bacterium]|nr:glycerophosphodiester phosphodiesterase [Crocinitomicaceae bacterium]